MKIQPTRLRKSLPFIAGILLPSGMDAAVTYLDASSGSGGNTTLANGSTFTPPLNGTTATDNDWEQRTTFGSSGNIFESNGEVSSENAPELRTRITGLTPGYNYNIFVYFWDPTSEFEDWNIRAGTVANPGANTLYSSPDATGALSSTGAVLASSQTFASAPTVLLEGARDLRAASLGVVAANLSGQIDIYVDDLGNAGSVNLRTWYDGVGFEFNSVPEPSAALLGGIGVLALLRRRL